MKIGDTVKFKIGGPAMMVTYILNNGKICCTWFDSNNVKQEANFPPEVLEHV
jgi:uncharacterized protein YodC (DUF2158 family)